MSIASDYDEDKKPEKPQKLEGFEDKPEEVGNKPLGKQAEPEDPFPDPYDDEPPLWDNGPPEPPDDWDDPPLEPDVPEPGEQGPMFGWDLDRQGDLVRALPIRLGDGISGFSDVVTAGGGISAVAQGTLRNGRAGQVIVLTIALLADHELGTAAGTPVATERAMIDSRGNFRLSASTGPHSRSGRDRFRVTLDVLGAGGRPRSEGLRLDPLRFRVHGRRSP